MNLYGPISRLWKYKQHLQDLLSSDHLSDSPAVLIFLVSMLIL